MHEEAFMFGLRVSWTKPKLQNLDLGSTPSPIIADGNTVDSVEEFTYLGSIQWSSSNFKPEYIRRIGHAASAMKRLYCIWRQSKLSIATKLRIYSTCVLSTLRLQDLDSYTSWLEKIIKIPSICGTNDASCTSAGTISCLTMRFCVVLACSTSPTSFVNKDWVSLVTLPDFEVMHRQTRSFESVPRWGTVTGLRRSGDAPAVVHPPPGFTRSAVTRVSQRRRPWS